MIRKIVNDMYIPLSGEEVLRICNHKSNIMTYPEIHKYDNIDDILKNGSCIILYEYSNNGGNVFGHYTCVNKLNNNEIEMFDSFGTLPDKERFFIDEMYRRETNQDYPYLLTLLDKSNKRISYNHYILQSDDTSTCGRYVGLRILLKHLTLEKFVKLLHNKDFPPDYVITYITSNII